MTSGVVLLLQATLKIFAKLNWLITAQVMWLKAAQVRTHPLLSGPKRDRSRGCKRCKEGRGKQKTRTLFAVAVSISFAVTCTLWPSTSNSMGHSGSIQKIDLSWSSQTSRKQGSSWSTFLNTIWYLATKTFEDELRWNTFASCWRTRQYSNLFLLTIGHSQFMFHASCCSNDLVDCIKLKTTFVQVEN